MSRAWNLRACVGGQSAEMCVRCDAVGGECEDVKEVVGSELVLSAMRVVVMHRVICLRHSLQ